MGQAHAVVRARVVDANAVVTLPERRPPETASVLPGMRRPAVRVEVLEVLKGEAAPGPLHLLQHGHGVAQYRAQEEVLLFVRPTKTVRELADPRLVEAAPWTSLQQHDDRFLLDPERRVRRLEAARAYVALAALPPDERAEPMAKLTVDLLLASDERLASMALLDLTGGGIDLSENPAALARLETRVFDLAVPLGFRVGLLEALTRRGILNGGSHWVRLLKSGSGSERAAICTAAGRHPSGPVTAELIRLLHGDDKAAATAAAVALGGAGHVGAVPALADALRLGDAALRNAAIRGLGRIGDEAAREKLRGVAKSHRDAGSRRRAAAELRARFEETATER